MKKSLVILAPFTSLPGEPSFNRFLYLAYLLSETHEVTLLTSSFNHPTKRHRNVNDSAFENLPFELILINEPGYKKNASFERLFSHHQFTNGVKKWLIEQQQNNVDVDIIYSAYPLIATNLLIAKFKSHFNYRIIIDVQDVWPESISSVIPIVSKLPCLLAPITARAEKAYAAADALVAVSNTYLERAKKNNPSTSSMVVYIGSDKQQIDSIKAIKRDDNKIKLIYLGTISYSYDLETVVKGINLLRNENSAIELHILGDGPNRDYIESISEDGIFFHGLIGFEEMVAFAKSCDVFVNPITASATQSITNKLSDYFSLRKPIINSQKNPEVVELIDQIGGVHYESGSIDSFCKSVNEIMTKLDESTDSCQVDESKIDELFDRNISYKRLVEFITNQSNEKK